MEPSCLQVRREFRRWSTISLALVTKDIKYKNDYEHLFAGDPHGESSVPGIESFWNYY